MFSLKKQAPIKQTTTSANLSPRNVAQREGRTIDAPQPLGQRGAVVGRATVLGQKLAMGSLTICGLLASLFYHQSHPLAN